MTLYQHMILVGKPVLLHATTTTPPLVIVCILFLIVKGKYSLWDEIIWSWVHVKINLLFKVKCCHQINPILVLPVIGELTCRHVCNYAHLCPVDHSGCETGFPYTVLPTHGPSAQMAFGCSLSSVSLAHLYISCTFNSHVNLYPLAFTPPADRPTSSINSNSGFYLTMNGL